MDVLIIHPLSIPSHHSLTHFKMVIQDSKDDWPLDEKYVLSP